MAPSEPQEPTKTREFYLADMKRTRSKTLAARKNERQQLRQT
jgi:hypothetical protein